MKLKLLDLLYIPSFLLIVIYTFVNKWYTDAINEKQYNHVYIAVDCGEGEKAQACGRCPTDKCGGDCAPFTGGACKLSKNWYFYTKHSAFLWITSFPNTELHAYTCNFDYTHLDNNASKNVSKYMMDFLKLNIRTSYE